MIRRTLSIALLACAAGAACAQDAPTAAGAATPAPSTPAATPAAATGQPAAEQAVPTLEPSAPPAAVTPVVDPLVKTDTKEGTGREAGPGSTVRVHYTGWLYKPMAPRQRARKFDSSLDRGEPIEFVVGVGRVIKGWDQGIIGMKEGGKRTLIIPSHLAYGKRGAPGGGIPPDADLIFDVELVSVK